MSVSALIIMESFKTYDTDSLCTPSEEPFFMGKHFYFVLGIGTLITLILLKQGFQDYILPFMFLIGVCPIALAEVFEKNEKNYLIPYLLVVFQPTGKNKGKYSYSLLYYFSLFPLLLLEEMFLVNQSHPQILEKTIPLYLSAMFGSVYLVQLILLRSLLYNDKLFFIENTLKFLTEENIPLKIRSNFSFVRKKKRIYYVCYMVAAIGISLYLLLSYLFSDTPFTQIILYSYSVTISYTNVPYWEQFTLIISIPYFLFILEVFIIALNISLFFIILRRFSRFPLDRFVSSFLSAIDGDSNSNDEEEECIKKTIQKNTLAWFTFMKNV